MFNVTLTTNYKKRGALSVVKKMINTNKISIVLVEEITERFFSRLAHVNSKKRIPNLFTRT